MDDWTAEYLQQIDDCEQREARMSEWEQGFISSIRSQIEGQGKRPSQKQSDTLTKIWEKITEKG